MKGLETSERKFMCERRKYIVPLLWIFIKFYFRNLSSLECRKERGRSFTHVAKRLAVSLSPALSSQQKSACDANALPDCEITCGTIKTFFPEVKRAKRKPFTVKRIVSKKYYRAGVNLQTNTQTICSRALISYYKKYAPDWVLPHPITYKTHPF